MKQQLNQPMVCAAVVTTVRGTEVLAAPTGQLYVQLELIAANEPMSARVYEVASYN